MTRRHSTFPLLACLVCLAGCPPACETVDPTEILKVTVLADPVGGQNLSTVSTSWQAEYLYSYGPGPDGAEAQQKTPPKGIELAIKYTNDKGGTYAAQTAKFTVGAAGGTAETLTFSAPAGLSLDKTFWAVFTWVDSRGAQEVNSGKAVFTVR